MKKFLSCLFIIIFCMTTISIATTEDFVISTNDLENEVIEMPEEFMTNLSETIYEKDDVYKMDEEVKLSGIVDANAYIMGKTANLKDLTVYGNVYVMAETINFENVEIGGSVYAMAKDINFSGIANDIYFLGSEINFTSDSQTLRNTKMAGGTITLNGAFGRSVLVSCEELKVLDEAKIQEKLTYYSANEASIAANAQIGEKEFIQEDLEEEKEEAVKVAKKSIVISYIMKFVTMMLKTLVVSLIIVFCINKFEKLNRTENIVSDFAKNAGIGCLNLIFVPIVSILLMLTGVGVGLGIILVILYIIGIYLSISFTSTEIAKRIIKNPETEKNFKAKYIGLSVLISAIIGIIGLLPVIGGIVKFILALIGLGILFNLVFQKNKE